MPSEMHIVINERGAIILPADLRRRHRLDEPGAQVRVVEREDGVIELHPELPVPTDQMWFRSTRWQRMERAADEDITAGRLARFDDVDAFLSELGA